MMKKNKIFFLKLYPKNIYMFYRCTLELLLLQRKNLLLKVSVIHHIYKKLISNIHNNLIISDTTVRLFIGDK